MIKPPNKSWGRKHEQIVTINDKPPKSCKFHKKWQFDQANQNMMGEFTCRAFGRCLLWLVALDVPLTCSNKFAWVVASIIYSVFSRSSFSVKGGGKVGQVVLLGKSTEKTFSFLWLCSVYTGAAQSHSQTALICANGLISIYGQIGPLLLSHLWLWRQP